MTDAEIELPPLPKPDAQYITHTDFSLLNYGRKCYEAGLAAARAEQAQPAKPKVYSTTVCLSSTGLTVWPMTSDDCCATVTLRWTDDGRAWIESERNRGLAKELRRLCSAGASIHCVTAADALDGGAR